MLSTQQKFSIGYCILTVLGLLLIHTVFSAPQSENLSYRDFKTLLKAGKVVDLTLRERTITGHLTTDGLEGLLPKEKMEALRKLGQGEQRFVTVQLDDPTLIPDLEAAGVQFQGRIESQWLGTLLSWMIPPLVFVAIWGFLMRRMGPASGLMSIGKSKAKVYVAQTTGVTFDDVAGIDEARAELREIVDFLKRPEHYRRLGGTIPKGVLLVGAPGTGKTLLAKAVAGEAEVPFFSLSGADFVEMFVGVGAARVRDLFAQAQTRAPSIIFIDELDALGKARGVSPMMGGHDEREQTLNQLLAEMDGFDTQKGVILLAATNRPEILDPALLRPGRFDRQVVIDRPDLKGRAKILQVHTRQVTLAPAVALEQIAARTPGFVGADLANLVNEAALRAAREGKDTVEMVDFEETIDRMVAGLERKSRVINPKEKEIVAYHEAGHARVAESRPHADRVAKISIIPRGVAALGYTQQQPTEDRYLMTRAELLDRLDVLLGGRTAEEIIFGDVSTGAQDDLQRATDLVRQHDHALRHERSPGARDLRGAPARPLPGGADRRPTRVQRRHRAGHRRGDPDAPGGRTHPGARDLNGATGAARGSGPAAHDAGSRGSHRAHTATGDSGIRGGPVCARGLRSRGRDGRGSHATCDVLIEWGANKSERCAGV
jgi:cell division protease FtsH